MRNRSLSRLGCGVSRCSLLLLMLCVASASRAAISFVQQNNATPQSPQSSVSVTYSAAQAAGDTNVVAAGWSDSTSTIASVTDTMGNVYALAIGPTRLSGVQSQSIYVAKNVRAATAGQNIVTVTFSNAVAFADVRILAYRGLDTNAPVEAAVGATGNGTSSNSGSLTTTNANDLLFAANYVTSLTSSAGTGYTSRVITRPDGDIAEDRIVTTAGTYNATASMSSGGWVMQLVSLKAAGSQGTTATPSINPGTGTYNTAQSVTLSDATTGATIYYTNDGSTPTIPPTGTTTQYAGTAIAVTTTGTTVKAIASSTGNLNSAVASATYTLQAATPAFSPAPGTYSSTQQVSISDATPGTTIYYTTDNSNPTTASPVYSAPISVSATTTIKAMAAATGFGNSAIATGAYTIQAPTTATPTMTPAGGTYNTTQSVTLADATTGATIYYTTDGTTPTIPPTGTTTQYTGTAIGVSTTGTTIKAIASSSGNLNSAVATATYTLVATQPTFSPAPGSYASSQSVTLADATSGVTIYYTTDNSNPTTASPVYSAPIAVNATTTIKAMAARTGFGNSTVATGTYTIGVTTPPGFVQANYAVPQTASASVTVTYTSAQTAGNLNVVVVGWTDTLALVNSVVDTAGNVYTRAIGPTAGNSVSQSIYYATNITAAGAGVNKVTVTFSAPASFPDIRILEYQGIDTLNPVDVAVGGSGSSSSSSSGPAVTSNANDLLFAANVVSTLTSGPGTGYTSRVLTSPNGDIAEDQLVSAIGTYTATAPLSSAGAWVMQLVAFRAAGSPPPGPDTTPPTVSITAPTQGATVSGFVTLTANANDNRGIAGVQFKVDGSNIGAEITTYPYTLTWDASSVTGNHTLTAVARDTSNNLATSSGVTVTVQSAAINGQWQGPFAWPMVSVHTMLMRTGKLLALDGQTIGAQDYVWDPVANTFTLKVAADNLFCSGQISLWNGKILVMGGHNNAAHVGLNTSDLFDPATQTWTHGPNMTYARWYPTATALPDGRILVVSGETNCDGCYETKHEIYNPTSNSWSLLGSGDFSFTYYPHSFILPDGRWLVSSTAETPIISQVFDFNTKVWTPIGTTALDGGSAVMYRAGKILKLGTSVNPDLAVRNSMATAYVLDMTQPSPAWRQVASMAFPRTYMTTTMLPDGNVLVTGGGRTTDAIGLSGAVLQAEIWNPTTETFTTVASMVTPRLYHSTAILMPDGRVVVSGGGRFNSSSEPTDQPSHEYYLPPYLFKGARPTITSAPATIQYAQNFTVQTPDAASITSVVLMRLGSVTHAFNMSQNYVPVTFQTGAGSLTVTAPGNGNLAPPGDYMLFILNGNGVPSVAAIVNLPPGTGSTQPPSAPTNLVANGALGSASLSWTASTGPNGVSGYYVYRATAPGVVTSVANRVGQPTGTSFVDTTMPSSGTYYYVVTAHDAVGTESAASNEAVATVTADTTPPSDPSNLGATAISNSQINLSWTGSTDNVGVSQYRVERCQNAGCANFVQIATPTSTTFNDTGLAASTSYSYRVRAADAAGNVSNYSNVASATTSAVVTPPATPTFVQQNSAVPQTTSTTSVTVTFTGAQTAGNLNVVAVGWNNTTAVVTAVTDTAGNVYTRAVGPTMGTGLAQSIYYAKNIASSAAGVNKVTVTFSPAAAYPDIRILEYSGIDPITPVDVTAANVGSTATSSSGAVTTTNASDLLFGANTVATLTSGPGAGFTSRAITNPNGDIAEDEVVSATGSYSATAPVSPSGAWVMQMVAFRAAGSPSAPARMVESGGNPTP